MIPYDNSGSQVSTPMSITLPPHGRREIIIGTEFTNPSTIGYLIFETDSEYAEGYTKFYTPGVYRVAIPAVWEVNTGDIYLTHIASDNYWWTGLSLLNTTSSPKTLTLEFDNGETRTIPLNPKEHKAILISSLFNGPVPLNIHSAVIKNGSGVIGLELFCGGNQLSGIPLTDDVQTKLTFPHVANEWPWWTGVVAYNPFLNPTNLTISPFSDQGTQLPTQTLTLNGKEKYIGVVSNLNLPDNTAWFKIEGTVGITGFELFGTADGNQLAGFDGMRIGGKEGVFAKLEKNGWTGIAFVNTKNTPARITLTAYDDSGRLIATTTFTLNAYEKKVAIAEDLFTQGITNATYIAYTSDQEVVGFQLNGSWDGTMLDGLPGM